MDIRTQSALLAAIVGFALGLSMLLRANRPRVLTAFSVFSLIVAGYYFSQFFHAVIPGQRAPWLSQVGISASLILGAMVPSAALSFFLEFLQVRPTVLRYGRRAAFLSALFGFAVGLTPLSNNFWARFALAAWVLLALSVSVSLLIRRMGTLESRIERARLRYLAWGAAASIVFAGLDFLGKFGLPFPAFGPIIATLYLFFLAQTLLRLRLMDLHELLGKIASQTVLAAILAAVFATLTIWVEANNDALFLFNTVVAAFVMLILLEPVRAKVEEQVVAIFFRERFELLRALTQLKARTANIIDVEELTRVILDGFNETRRVTHASVYLLADDRPGYRLRDFRGPQPHNFLDQAQARGLLNAASGGQKAVLQEHLDRRIQELRQNPAEHRRHRDEVKKLNDTKQSMHHMKAGITVPLVGNDRVIGFLNLWDERVPEAFASDEIAQVLEIAEQMAIVVENSKLYERMRERDRLAALGEMAAGLAHEIRNPLGAIKGAAQCLDPQKLPGEDGEFLEVIVEEVNRLNGVVTAFLDYSRPLKQNFAPTDLNDVVTRTLRLIQNDIPERIQLKLELAEHLNKVDADAEQLKQVLINLVQNAVQAGGDKGASITIRTSRLERFSEFRGSTEMVEVQVVDDGPGIPADQQLNIFVPFFTTKQKGTGLGLAISQRIVKSHGGVVTVQSKAGEGSTFIVRLPALPGEAAPPSSTPVPDGTPFPGTLEPPSRPSMVTVPEPSSPPEKKSRRHEKKKRRAG